MDRKQRIRCIPVTDPLRMDRMDGGMDGGMEGWRDGWKRIKKKNRMEGWRDEWIRMST